MISVILPVRDGLPWLDDQLRALASQRCDEPWEVVVADNGSTDASVETASRWSERWDSLRVIDASAKAGPAAARNAGVRSAHGQLLAFCDADDVVQPGWLQACVTALGQADVVAGTFDLSMLNNAPPAAPGPAGTSQLGFLPAGLAANLAVRAEAFSAVGGFSEELLIGEDIDLCWRLQLDGFQFAVAVDALVAKREREDWAALFRRAVAFGRCGPLLYRRYRGRGAKRDLAGAAKSWLWVLVTLPRLGQRHIRRSWVRAVGVRIGRLAGSGTERVFFP